MRTVLSYWTAIALGAYEMSLLTVEVKVFITRRRRPHSPSSGRDITSLWDSRDGLRRHLFEVRFYCNWSHFPHSHKSLRARFLKHVGGISILTAFPASSRHGLRGADAKAVSCELYICNCQRHAEAQELETTNTYWLMHCSGFRAWVRGGQNWNENGLQNKGGKKEKTWHSLCFTWGNRLGQSLNVIFSLMGMKGEKKCTVPSQMAKASKKGHMKHWH